jgi:hypothetical protein
MEFLVKKIQEQKRIREEEEAKERKRKQEWAKKMQEARKQKKIEREEQERRHQEELERIYLAISKSNCIQGICYTQLTDVEQEVNGLLTFDRKFKIDPSIIKKINEMLDRK